MCRMTVKEICEKTNVASKLVVVWRMSLKFELDSVSFTPEV